MDTLDEVPPSQDDVEAFANIVALLSGCDVYVHRSPFGSCKVTFAGEDIDGVPWWEAYSVGWHDPWDVRLIGMGNS